MNRNETKQILAVLRTAYPNFYRGIPNDDLRGIVDLWSEMFKDEPAQLVAVAVKAMIASRTNTFPPNIGEIKEQITKMRMPNEMTAAEAWTLVANAIRNGLYGAQEEFDRLPPTVKRLVGSPQQLREWAEMEADTVMSVVASNFQRSYNVRAKSDREYAALPSDIRQMISGVADQLALMDGENKEIGG